MADLKRTPLYPVYEAYGAKTVDFGGWDLPVQFKHGIMEEHRMTREKAALFDVSHMGEILVEGTDSLAFLQKMVTNDVAKLEVNRAQYTFMCNEAGGTIDDFLIYKRKESAYLLVVNAANIDKDVAWLKAHHKDEQVSITNQSEDYALLAIQGPLAEQILQQTTSENVNEIRPFRFQQEVKIDGVAEKAIVSRTGYTGEDGFEIYIPGNTAVDLWEVLMRAGGEDLMPAGLGARDSLRFEAGLPLYGQELSETITPVEAGLHFAVKVKKETDFIGKQALASQLESGTERKLVALEMIEKGIPRTDYPVLDEQEQEIGFVTTGTQSPTLKKAIGFALLDTDYTEQGTEVYVQVRKRRVKGVVIPAPFYRREK